MPQGERSRAVRLFPLILGLAISALAAPTAIRAEDAVNTPVYVVTYFDIAPSAAVESAALARQYAEASRKEPGNVGFEMFAEIGRPNRFATLETWHDKAAYEA